MQARGLDAELAPIARLGERDVTHVIFKIEIRVIDPIRVVEAERHVGQLAAEALGQVQALLDEAEDVLEADE